MSVFKYADNTEPPADSHEDLDELLNEGEADEGEAPLGAEILEKKDEVKISSSSKKKSRG